MTEIITLALLSLMPISYVQMPSGCIARYENGNGAIFYNTCEELQAYIERKER